MRAKRSKKYRKIMQTYQIQYSFREPYQVLCTSTFLRAIHAYHMPTPTFLENTLHGRVTPYITQCTLAAVMEGFTGKGRDGRPPHLPAPTLIPLRYCKHKDENGQDRGAVSETECLYDLISGQVKGNEVKRNKQHFIVASADWDEGVKDETELEQLDQKRRKRRKSGENIDVDIRDFARTIPGVPVVYVKRSVMILEEPSAATERAIKGGEKEKYRDGVGGAVRGQKRGHPTDSSDEDEPAPKVKQPSLRGTTRAKAPNPLSVMKKKTRPDSIGQDKLPAKKKRKRGRRGKGQNGDQSVADDGDDSD